MFPAFKTGDEVIAVSPFFKKLKAGDVIIFNHSAPPHVLIKRIIKISNNKFWVEGDNKKVSIDSRSFGFILKKDIIGKVVLKI